VFWRLPADGFADWLGFVVFKDNESGPAVKAH
jgi:hypothetical protein